MSHEEITSKSNHTMGTDNRFLEFSLGQQSFAVSLLKVKEVVAPPPVTPIPFTPEHFVGIMNLRGQVISILDLRKKMKIHPLSKNDENAVIIIEVNPVKVGILVDSINTVLSVDPNEIAETPHLEQQIRKEYIQGIVRRNEKFTILVDIEKILDISDLTAIHQQQQQHKTTQQQAA